MKEREGRGVKRRGERVKEREVHLIFTKLTKIYMLYVYASDLQGFQCSTFLWKILLSLPQ